MRPEWDNGGGNPLWIEVWGPVLRCHTLLCIQEGCFSKRLPAKNKSFYSDGIFLRQINILFVLFWDYCWHHLKPRCCRYLTHSISFTPRFVPSLCLFLWTPCLIYIRERPSWVGAGWQLMFVFCLQYVHLIQPLIVCGVLFGGLKRTASVQIARFVQQRTMMQSDPRPTAAHKHTRANTHYPNQSVWQPLLGIIGQKKPRRKSIGQWPPWNKLLLLRHTLFPHVHHCVLGWKEGEAGREWRI